MKRGKMLSIMCSAQCLQKGTWIMGPSVEDHIYQAETSGIIYATVNDGELAMLFVIWSVTFSLK